VTYPHRRGTERSVHSHESLLFEFQENPKKFTGYGEIVLSMKIDSPLAIQGLVHPYLLDGFLPTVQAISRNGTCTSPLIATGSQHQG
jgi:hypothetical protein